MNPDQTINLNQNTAECIKGTYKFGSTIYKNICNGNTAIVDWGGADWALSIFLLSLGTIVVAGAIFFAFIVLHDMLEY